MNVILKVIGAPQKEDMSYMSVGKQKAFLNTYEHHKGKNFSSLFPDEDDE